MALEPSARLRLARKARVQPDSKSGKLAILSPESLLLLNDSGAAIVGLIDGQRSATEIAAALAGRFGADPAQVEADVVRYLEQLLERRLVERVPREGLTP